MIPISVVHFPNELNQKRYSIQTCKAITNFQSSVPILNSSLVLKIF